MNQGNKKESFLFFFTLILSLDFKLINPDRSFAKFEFVEKLCNMEKRNSTRYFILLYGSPLVIFREHQMGYIISWWISKFLGRAGFEPA